MRKITLVVKFDEMYVHVFKITSVRGALVESQAGDPEDHGSLPSCVI